MPLKLPAQTYRDQLYALLETVPEPYRSLGKIVVGNDKFATVCGSVDKHHAYTNGLLEHTTEVVSVASHTAALNPKLNRTHIILGSIWHDFGKIYDYELSLSEHKWVKTKHCELVRHVTRSYAMFLSAGQSLNLPPSELDAIGHIILAHHGHKEWGSPVVPVTPEAYAVHLADMVSVHCINPAPIIPPSA